MLSEPLSYGALRYIARGASQFPDCGYVFATGRVTAMLSLQRFAVPFRRSNAFMAPA
jgi:hypothetical protein